MNTLLDKLSRYKERHGFFALARLPFFPLSLLITNFIRIIHTIWYSRVLANGKWSDYNRYRSQNGINSLFYWTQALNFDRFGRNGTSANVGAGDYHLGNWWFNSLTSLYLYRHLGALLPVLSMFGWICFHLLWIGQPGVDVSWLICVLSLSIISSYFYGAAFVFMNYSAFGWLFAPLALYGLFTGNYILAAVGWLGASLGSITIIVIGSVVTLAWSIAALDALAVLTLGPAILKLSTHFLFVENLSDSLRRVASGIGLVRGKTIKYNYTLVSRLPSLLDTYIIVSYILYIAVCYFLDTTLAIVAASVLFLLLVNKYLARFADTQSIYMAMFTVSTTITILTPNFILLLAYWLVVSPLPVMVDAAEANEPFDAPKAYPPFKVKGLLEKSSLLLKDVPHGARVLLALDDPKGRRNKIFDGYRVIYELLFYQANVNDISIFPDWHAIFKYNFIDSPGFWGRSPAEAIENMRRWNADYLLVYQVDTNKLDPVWEESGFQIAGMMDWVEIQESKLRVDSCWPDTLPPPIWWLLKASSNIARDSND